MCVLGAATLMFVAVVRMPRLCWMLVMVAPTSPCLQVACLLIREHGFEALCGPCFRGPTTLEGSNMFSELVAVREER